MLDVLGSPPLAGGYKGKEAISGLREDRSYLVLLPREI